MSGFLRPALDRFVGWACRGLLGLFFRRVEVVGAERLPEHGPFVVVANHVNGLLDPMFVLGPLRVPARVLGKSTIWRIPLIAQLADLAGAIPVYRRHDPGVDSARNVESFERCFEELARLGMLALFPEGISHDEPGLQPLRTGAARIAIGAERRRGPLGVKIVPVGLVFEARERFRSRALVVVGEPIDPSEEVRLAESDEASAVRRLTDRIAAALARVTLNFSSWEEARLIEFGAGIYQRLHGGEPPRRMAHEFEARAALALALGRLRVVHPHEVEAAVITARAYEDLLRTVGVTDVQATARVPRDLAFAFVARTLARLLLASPVALLGTLLNLVPYGVVHAISLLLEEQPNQIATYKLFPALVLYPATWVGWGVAAASWLGTEAGVALGLVAPFAGWVALRWHERRRRLWRESRAVLVLRRRADVAAELLRRRAHVDAALDRLVALARQLPSPVPVPSFVRRARSAGMSTS
ncbi:MAG TPA: lysophospholipid acyltransferase family protein [Thermoanaerobaculia bacterium]